MKAVEKVVSYIIPIIVLVLLILYFYGGTGALTKLKDNKKVRVYKSTGEQIDLWVIDFKQFIKKK